MPIIPGQSVQTQGSVVINGSSGSIVLTAGSNITLSQNASTVTIDAANQTNQTLAIYVTGNSTGASSSSTYDARTLTISAAGSFSVGWTGGSLMMAASQTVQTQNLGTDTVGISNLGNTSGTSGVASGVNVQFLLAGGNNVTLSQSVDAGNKSVTVTISAANQTVESQTLGISNLGNTSGTSGVASGGQVRYLLAGGNNITLSQSVNGASGTVTISAANQTAASNTFGISNLGNTSGTSGVASGNQAQLILAGGNNVTLSQSLNGASATVTISAGGGAQSVQTIGVYASSQTVGQSSSSTIDARSFTHVGQGIISVGMSGGSLLFSATTPSQTVESQTLGISNVGNTSGTSGVASGGQVQLVLAGGNNITLSQSLNGASATITVSGPNTAAQSVQTIGIYASSNTTGASSSSTVDARSLSIVAQGSASVGWTNGSLIVSASQTVQTQNLGTDTIGISNLGNTSGTSGVVSAPSIQFLLAGGNNITLSQSVDAGNKSATVTISAFNQTVESQTMGISNLGNTSGTSGVASGGQVRYLFAGGNNITLSQSVNGASGTVTISAFNQTVESQTIGISNLGNSAGTSGVASGGQVQYLFAGGNNITLSQSLNGASGTVTVIGPTPGAAAITLGMSNLGNSSGTSGTVNQQLYLAGGANITLSQSINGQAATVSVSGNPPDQMGISNIGNTLGNTGLVTGQLVLAGGNNVTLSGSTNAGSMTVTISSPEGTIQIWEPWPIWNTAAGSQVGHRSVYFYKLQPECWISATRLLQLISATATSTTNNSTYGYTISVKHGIYTQTGSSLSLITASSISSSFSVTNSSNNATSQINGIRGLTSPLTINMTPGDYWIGMWSSTASGNLNSIAVSNLVFAGQTAVYSGHLGGGVNATQGIEEGQGVYSNSTTELPATVAFSEITQSSQRTASPQVIVFKGMAF